jgi:DNA (cytosine-5)-methyltransferase 1
VAVIANKRTTVKNNKPVLVDLFCGAGGLSSGLEMAGYEPRFALDCDPHAISTYRANHPNVTAVCDDISVITGSAIKQAIGTNQIDLLAGGPSCQGFSTHGKRKKSDPRNFLFKEFMRIAAELKPNWILIENVQGLLTYNKGYFKKLIIAHLNELGYDADARVLCAADYGVPQLRRRIFFIASRKGKAISFPSPTHSDSEAHLTSYVTVQDAIGDLPPLFAKGKWQSPEHYLSAPSCEYQTYARDIRNTLTLHVARPLSAQAYAIAKVVKEGSGLRSVPFALLPERFKRMRTISDGSLRRDCTTLYYRLSRQRPAYTITCYFRNVASGPFLHPTEHRSLSYREAARLMSFKDTYKFVGANIARQIGNAVPPLLAKAVGRHILSLDRGDKASLDFGPLFSINDRKGSRWANIFEEAA